MHKGKFCVLLSFRVVSIFMVKKDCGNSKEFLGK